MDNFAEIDQKFGFGCMRLPMTQDKKVDTEQFSEMITWYLKNGFNYFDTAHGYLDGKSELAIKECLTSKYPRDQYILTDKLTGSYFRKEEEIRPLFASQLHATGVDYFDFYLMHAQNAHEFEKFKKCHAYETALELKKEGKIRHFGISFHDKAEVLEKILTEYPQIEIVQIQFNYLDYEDPSIESRKVYEVCEKYDKPVIVMEPVKGGSLVKLPEDAQSILDALGNGSNASYAIRFAASFPNVRIVLSGMSTLEQMKDNVSFMKDFVPLNEEEKKALQKVTEVFHSHGMIPCTACHYCVEENHCPQKIRVPDLFAVYNAKKTFHDWNADYYYHQVLTKDNGRAGDCIKCGMCEKVCPQHLSIRDLLADVSNEFDQK